MGHARYVGRVGSLAVALGVGFAVASAPFVAAADDAESATAVAAENEAPADNAEPADNAGPNVDDADPQPLPDEPDPDPDSTGGIEGSEPDDIAPEETTDVGPVDEDSVEPADIALPPPAPADLVEQSPPVGVIDSTDDPERPFTRVEEDTDDVPAAPEGLRTSALTVPTSNLPTADAANGLAPQSAALTAPTNPIEAVLQQVQATIYTTVVNAIVGFFEGIVGPGAPLENAGLWAMLVFARREINRIYANSTPVLDLQTSGQQDLDDRQIHGTLGASDVDGDILGYVVSTGPANGTVTIDAAQGTWTYTPDVGFSGTDEFRITASDVGTEYHLHRPGHTHTVSDAIAVTVAPPSNVNDAPAISAVSSVSDQSDTGSRTYTVVVSDEDTPLEDLTLTVSQPADGTGVVSAPSRIGPDTFVFTYTPAPLERLQAFGAAGPRFDSFVITVTDTAGATAQHAVDDAVIDPVEIANAGVVNGISGTGNVALGSDGTLYHLHYPGLTGSTVTVVRPGRPPVQVPIDGQVYNGGSIFQVETGVSGFAYVATTTAIAVIKPDDSVEYVALTGKLMSREPVRDRPLIVAPSGHAYAFAAYDSDQDGDYNTGVTTYTVTVINPDGTSMTLPIVDISTGGWGYSDGGVSVTETRTFTAQSVVVADDGTAYVRTWQHFLVIRPGNANPILEVNKPQIGGRSVALGPDGRAYIVDGNADVRVIGPDGSTGIVTDTPYSNDISPGPVVSEDGVLFSVMYRYTTGYQAFLMRAYPDGTYSGSPLPGGYPRDAAVGLANGRVYFNLGILPTAPGDAFRVAGFIANSDGPVLELPFGSDFSGDRQAVNDDGHVFIYDSTAAYRENNDVIIVNPDNSWATVTFDDSIAGVVAGRDGRTFVTTVDYAAGSTAVHVFNPDNSYTTVTVAGDTQVGVLVTPEGNAYQITSAGLHVIGVAALLAG